MITYSGRNSVLILNRVKFSFFLKRSDGRLLDFILFTSFSKRRDVLYHYYRIKIYIRNTIRICPWLLVWLFIAWISSRNVFICAHILRELLVNSLLWPTVLAALWSALLFETMCARKQIHCQRIAALSSTPLLRLVSLYPAETQHLLSTRQNHF